MSKEAKIGLLLGLVFIVAIAIVLKGVRRNSNSDPGEKLAQNGTISSQTETDLGNDGGLDMPGAAGQFDNTSQPESNENDNTMDPVDDGVSDNNQKDIVIPAPTTNHATFPPPRHVVDIPSTEPTTPPESTGGVIVSFGDPEPRDGEWSYVVKKGDVLWNIAQNELGDGTRMHEISLLNNLANPDDLKIGQTLRMPSRQHRTSNSPGTIQNSGAATASGGREYIVRQGETLGLIAINELGSFARWPEIQRLNNLPNDKVMEGQKIRLPDRQSTTNMSSSNTVPADGRLYEVKGGETLWVIAQREFGDPYRWPEIQHLNNLPTEKVLKGQIIRLPNR